MPSQTTIYSGVLLLDAAISSWLAVLGGSRRGAPGSHIFGLLMWSIAAWSFTCAMEMLTPDPSAPLSGRVRSGDGKGRTKGGPVLSSFLPMAFDGP